MDEKEISQAVIGRLPRYFRYLGELKDSGVEWIGDIPETWEALRLKYCLEGIDSGTSVSRIMSWLFLPARMVCSATRRQGHRLVTCGQPLGRCLWSHKMGKGTIAAVKQSA